MSQAAIRPRFAEILRELLHSLMLVASVAVLLLPAARQGWFFHFLQGLFLLYLCRRMYRSWRLGYLKQTPGQIYARAEKGDRLSSGWLETLAGFSTLAAILMHNML